jgi:hypothetical protein
MGEMFGDITVKSRPLRLAFLIPPDKTVLRKVIQTNYTLWGGTFNPIITLYARPAKAWKGHPNDKISLAKRALGYVRAFDPDILVDCTANGLPPYLQSSGRAVIKIDEIWSGFASDPGERVPKYGVGLFELLNALYKEYFEAIRRFPVKVVLPQLPDQHQLFWSATVGELPKTFTEVAEADYGKAIDFEKISIDPTTYDSIRAADRIFPRQVTRFHLESETTGSHRDDALAFYMDADQLMDVVDFWNLRALGRSVIPIPKQFAQIPEYQEFVRGYVRANYRVSRFNPSIPYGTRIICSFNSEMSELQDLAKSLNVEKLFDAKVDFRALTLQHWYPRIWDEWAMGKDGATPDNVSCSEHTVAFSDTEGTVSFDLLKPEFVDDVPLGGPRYANEIYPKFYGAKENIRADVLPYDHGQAVLRAAGGWMSLRDELRIGRTGLVHLVSWNRRVNWKIPLAEEIFFAWLQDKGFDAKLSTCGILAKEVYSQLGGWLYPLTHERVLKLVERMNKGDEGDEDAGARRHQPRRSSKPPARAVGEQRERRVPSKGMPLGAVRKELKKADPTGNLYRSLVEKRVFQLGYRTQCIHCRRASWYGVDSLKNELVCPLCYKTISAISAVDFDNHGSWFLKTAGGASVGNYADGGFCVLLTLNFFERNHSLQTTPVMSFDATNKGSGKPLEADFGLMWQETVYGEAQDGILFAECKSYNSFEKKDFERMRTLAKQFPGAALAFCTLRSELTPNEIRELKKITKAGMKYWKPERPINPVLILTGTELFDFIGPPHCWDGITIPEWAKRAHTVLEVCNATQSIHLGLPHWQETWEAQFQARRQKRLTRSNRKKRH